MRIAVVLGEFPKLSERFLARELAWLAERDFDLRILALRRGPAAVFDEEPFASLRGRTSYLPHWASPAAALAKLTQLPGTFRAARAIPHLLRGLAIDPRRALTTPPRLNWGPLVAREARRAGCELIWAHWAGIPGAVGLVASWMTGLPFVLSCHAWDIFVNRTLVGAQLQSAAAVTVCSQAGLEHLRAEYGSAAERVRLVHHGVEVPEATPSARRREEGAPFRVLGVGRFVHKKGFEHLLTAAAQAEFAVTLMGEGPLESSLRAQARSLGIESRVNFLGLRDAAGMAEVFAECDCICAPSVVAADGDRDGVPNVLLEASLAGLPVVASDAGGIPDFLEDGSTGLAVPRGDAAALCRAVGRLKDEPELGPALVAAARQRIRAEFNLERTAAILADVLSAAAAG